MVMRRPLSLLAGLLAVLALVAAGCGGKESSTALPPTELTSFAAAASATAESESARFSLDLSQSLPGTDQTLSFGASGAFDTAAKRAQFDVDLSALVPLLGGLGGAFGGATGDLSTDPDDWRLEAILDGDVIYLNFPLLADKLPEGKGWIKGNINELAGQAGGELGQFGSFAKTDPRDALSYLDAISGGIETVGSDELRGVATTHYRASIDVAKAIALVPAAQREGLADLDQMLAQTGLSQIPVDVWLDADQRVHKLETAFEITAPGTTQTARTALTMELWDYGVPVELDIPSDADVVDAATLDSP